MPENNPGVKQINISEYGNVDPNPCNRPVNSRHLVVGAVAAAVVYLIFFVISLLDDGIRSDDDVERYLGLSVLGRIPDTNAPHSGKYGYYGYGQKKLPKHSKKSGAESEG